MGGQPATASAHQVAMKEMKFVDKGALRLEKMLLAGWTLSGAGQNPFKMNALSICTCPSIP